MPTCRDTITRALRKVRAYSAGEEPSASDMNDGMEELQSLYEHWASNGMFGRLTDVSVAGDYTAGEFERVTLTETGTVTIPTSFDDGGDSLPPYDMSYIEVVDIILQTVTRYLYDAGQWVEIGALTLDDEAPLASKGRGGLAACLAMAIAEEYGESVGPATMRQAAAFKTGLSLKLGGDAPRTAPDYF